MITRMLALIGLGVLLGALDSWIRPVQLHLNPQGPAAAPAPAVSSTTGTAPSVTPPDAPSGDALGLEITVPQAKALFDQGVSFIDARHDDEYNEQRVQNAFNLTSAMFDGGQPPQALSLLDPNLPVVIYCSGGDCDASHAVGIRLQQAGYTQIHIMKDGFPAWKAAGFPVDSGPPAR